MRCLKILAKVCVPRFSPFPLRVSHDHNHTLFPVSSRQTVREVFPHTAFLLSSQQGIIHRWRSSCLISSRNSSRPSFSLSFSLFASSWKRILPSPHIDRLGQWFSFVTRLLLRSHSLQPGELLTRLRAAFVDGLQKVTFPSPPAILATWLPAFTMKELSPVSKHYPSLGTPMRKIEPARNFGEMGL